MLSANKPVPIWFIPVFALLVWGGQYALRDLWEPDEARYAYVAREMAQSGSMMVPMRSGEAYTHKPPLMFWLMRAGTVLTGGEYNGISARFPTYLGGLLSLWAVTRLCLMWFDPQTAPQIAWRTFFILSTSSLFWQKAGTGQIDMLLLGLEMSALYFLFKNDETPALWRQAMAFSLMGLAILAKGPVGLIVPIGIYLTANIVSGQTRNIKKTYWLWGIPLALMWPGAWLLGAKASGASPEFFNELLFAQNIGRATGEFGGHTKPFYYYLQYLIVDFMPWFFFVPISVLALKNESASRKHLKMLAGWIGFVIVFFSLCSGKRNLYILSVYPAAGIIVAAAWPRLKQMTKKWMQGSVYPVIGIIMLLAVAGIVAPFVVDLPFNGLTLLPVSLVLGIGGLFLIHRYRSSGLDQGWFNRFIMVFLLVELAVGVILFPALNALKTPGVLAVEAKAYLSPSQRLLLYQMNGEIFAFYSNRKGLQINDLASLGAEMKRQGKGIVVFSQKNRQEIETRFPKAGSIKEFKMGGKELGFLKYDLTVP
ncbi:MAG: glycosyltransferase family 39 protein [Desulfosalsimonadaceae bacterium]